MAIPASPTRSSPCSRPIDHRRLEQMRETRLLRPEVADVRGGRRDLERNAVDHPEPVRFELLDLRGIVRHETDRLHPEEPQYAGRALVRPEVGGEAQDPVRVDRVEAVVLKMVRRDLVRDPDPPAFLGQVQEGAAGRLAEFRQRGVQLGAAVAALGSEHVPRDAFRVEAHEDILPSSDLSLDQGHVVLAGEGTLERVDAERPVPGREPGGPHEQDVVTQLQGFSDHARASQRGALYKNSAETHTLDRQEERCAAMMAGAAPIAVAVANMMPRPVRSKW